MSMFQPWKDDEPEDPKMDPPLPELSASELEEGLRGLPRDASGNLTPFWFALLAPEDTSPIRLINIEEVLT